MAFRVTGIYKLIVSRRPDGLKMKMKMMIRVLASRDACVQNDPNASFHNICLQNNHRFL